MQTYVILHNIRSALNVGSMFRTADGAGVSKIFLTGITPTPIDRFGRPHTRIQKTSLGASAFVEWEQIPDVSELLERLQEEGVSLVSVEQDATAIDYRTFTQTRDTGYLFGGEIDGVPKRIMRASDVVLEIPMHGRKESLNVAVTAGIILFSTRKED